MCASFWCESAAHSLIDSTFHKNFALCLPKSTANPYFSSSRTNPEAGYKSGMCVLLNPEAGYNKWGGGGVLLNPEAGYKSGVCVLLNPEAGYKSGVCVLLNPEAGYKSRVCVLLNPEAGYNKWGVFL